MVRQGDVWTHGFYQNSSFVASMEFFADSEAAGNGNIRFKSGGSTALTLDASQGATFAGTVDLGANAIFTQFIKSNSSVRIDIDSDNNQTDRSFLISKHNAGTELMRVNEDGTVGIGTSSPDFELDVAGSIGIDDKIYHNGDHNTYIGFSGDTQNILELAVVIG